MDVSESLICWAKFALNIKRIVIHHCATSFENGEIANNIIGRVGQVQTNSHIAFNTECAKASGGFINEFAELLIAPLAA